MLTKTRTVDFHYVEDHQKEMDAKLLNWARWVTPRAPSWISPMFRMAKSNARQWHQPEVRDTCDIIGAMLMEKEVGKLPEPHRSAIRWHYVIKSSPSKACRSLGLTTEGLAKVVRDGRQMLMNRMV